MSTFAQVRGVQQVPGVPFVVDEHLPVVQGQLTDVPPQPSARAIPHFPA
jgi:hypothetical protein